MSTHTNHAVHNVSHSSTTTSRSHANYSGGTFIRTIPDNATEAEALQLITAAVRQIKYSMAQPNSGYSYNAGSLSVPTSWSGLQSFINTNTAGLRYRRYKWGKHWVNIIINSTHVNAYDWNGGAAAKGAQHVSQSDGSYWCNSWHPITTSRYTAHANGHSSNIHCDTGDSTLDYWGITTNWAVSSSISSGAITVPSTFSVANAQTVLDRLNTTGRIVSTDYTYPYGYWGGTGHASHSSSSKKVKENIEDLKEEAVDLINKVKVVTFNYKEGVGQDPTIKHYGFIAEDTNEAFSTQYHDRMDYINCIGLLLKAVQELSQKIEKLENK